MKNLKKHTKLLIGMAFSFFVTLGASAQRINEIYHESWDAVPWSMVGDKLYRKYLYGSDGMIAKFKMDKGAHVPKHNHPNEQITYITKGSVKVMMNGREYIVKAGDVLIIPPNTPHEYLCLEDGTIDIDFFPTLRMDWLKGTSSYFGSDSNPKLEVVAELSIRPGNVAVSKTGRVFATIHPLGISKVQLVEIQKDKSYKPYPNMSFQKNGAKVAGSNQIDAPLGIFLDKKERLWVTDMGLELGRSRVWAFDIHKNKLIEKIEIPMNISPKGSFNQEIAVDEKNEWVYLADIQAPAIIAINLKTKAFRRFSASNTLKPEDKDMYIDGKLVYFGGAPARVAIDPLTLSDDRETIFFGAMSGNSWYSVPAKLFREGASDEAIAQAIKKVGVKPLSDGAFTDKEGNHYFTNLQEGAITKLDVKDGELYNIVQSPELSWPDNSCLGPDGYIYISVNQLHRTPAFTGGADMGIAPYHIYRFKPKK